MSKPLYFIILFLLFGLATICTFAIFDNVHPSLRAEMSETRVKHNNITRRNDGPIILHEKKLNSARVSYAVLGGSALIIGLVMLMYKKRFLI